MTADVINLEQHRSKLSKDKDGELIKVKKIIDKLKEEKKIVLFEDFITEVKKISKDQREVFVYYIAFIMYISDSYFAYKNERDGNDLTSIFYDKIICHRSLDLALKHLNHICNLLPFSFWARIRLRNRLTESIAHITEDLFRKNFDTLITNPGVIINSVLDYCNNGTNSFEDRFINDLNGTILCLMSLKLLTLKHHNPKVTDGLISALLIETPSQLVWAMTPILPYTIFHHNPPE